MASSTGHPAPVSRETYWKRRVFVLAGMLLVLAIITYACRPSSDNGDMQRAETDPPAPGSSPSVAPTGEGDAEPADPDDDADDADGEGGDADGEGGSGDGDGAEDGTGGSAGSAGRGGSAASVPAPERPEDLCRPQDVVVTLELAESGKEVYHAGQRPQFRLSVVNTAEQTCTVDVGPENMELRIRSGEDRVFSTADCQEGDGTENRQLRRGVPHVSTFTWDRERSFSDCREAPRTDAKPGTYVMRLHSAYDAGAEPVVFHLRS